MIKYKCDECGSSLTIKDELAGTKGKCPKCKTPFVVPESSGSPDAASQKKKQKPAAAARQEEMTEEDMIFGKDFFNMEEGAAPPQRPPAATFEAPAESAPKKKKKPKQPFGASIPDGDNSAQVASELLSKTGKKNKPSDFDEAEEEGKGGYDFSAINYLILWRIVPFVLGLGVLVPAFYWMFGSVLFSQFELPPLAEIQGVVRIDGEPLANTQVQFIPILDPDNPNPGGPSFAMTGADGSYKAMYKADISGAIIGKHQVRVTVGGRTFKSEINVAEGDNEKNIEFKLQ